MSPSHLLRIYVAECRKTFTRGSGIAALAIAAVVAILAVLVELGASRVGGDASMNGQPISQLFKATGGVAANWSLIARNFYILPLLLLWATGASVAGELKDHTLRELALRAVPRHAILAAKLASLATLSAATLIITALLASSLGMAIFGMEGEWANLALGYLSSWLADLALLSLGVLAALYFRSETGVVVGVVLFLMGDLGIRMLLKLVGMFGRITTGQDPSALTGGHWAEQVSMWMPGSALSVWEGSTKGWTWQPFLGLAILLVLSLGLSVWRLRRIDIP